MTFMQAWLYGFLHPLLAMDHLLAMIAVGLLSVQIGGRAVWSVPAAFVLTMAFGGLIALFGIELDTLIIEAPILWSGLLIALAISFPRQMPTAAAMFFVAFFALFHGFAHVIEAPEQANIFTYIFGFLCATSLMHLCGVGIGLITEFAGQSAQSLRSRAGAFMAGMAALALWQSFQL